MPTTDDYRAVSQQHYHVECNIAAECHKKTNNNNNWHRDKLCHRQVSGGGGGQIVAQGSRYREGYRISFFFFF